MAIPNYARQINVSSPLDKIVQGTVWRFAVPDGDYPINTYVVDCVLQKSEKGLQEAKRFVIRNDNWTEVEDCFTKHLLFTPEDGIRVYLKIRKQAEGISEGQRKTLTPA